jgi:hypothetical protein
MIVKEPEINPKLRETLLDTNELALELNVGPSTVRVWVSRKLVPYVQWGKRIYFVREHLPLIKMRMLMR